MKYAALLTNDAADVERWKSLSEDEARAARELEVPKWNALFAEFGPHVQFGAELDEPATARTVRVRDGETIVTDGPYAETKELIAGIFVLECDDLDQAIAIAEKVPLVTRGSVELRPLVENQVPEEQVPAAT